MLSRQRETNVRDWGDYREQGDQRRCRAGRIEEWETTRHSGGLGRLQRPGEVLSRQREEWETNGDS